MSEKNMVSEIIAQGEFVSKELHEVAKNPLKNTEAYLMKILSENANTEFGRKYGFKHIDSIEKFKASVPLTTYEDYQEYIDKMVLGEENQLTAKAPSCYVKTSGSVGTSKVIPVSKESVDGIMKSIFLSYALQRSAYKNPDNNEKCLFIVSYYDVEEFPSGALCGDIAGMTIDMMKSSYGSAYTTPVCSVYANEYHDFYYVHARFALVERNMPALNGVFMTDVFELVNYIIKNSELLFSDIEKGTINPEIKMSDEIKSELLKLIEPDPERATQLREIFSDGNYKGILQRIWPELSVITAIGSATFWPYTERVMEYAGQGVDFCHRTYAASEGQIGLVTELNSTKYCLLPHQMFYEFIKIEDSEKENPPTLNIDQLEMDKEYEIVLTNFSGFCRYRIMDVVKVVGFLNETPQVRFSFRRNQLINMAGEKTTTPQLVDAVSKCAKHFGCEIIEFAVYPNLKGDMGRYTILLETDSQDLKNRTSEVSQVMDDMLREANPEIPFIQSEGLLGSAEVQFVQPQTFALYKDMKITHGASKNQLKPVRVIDSVEKERFFFALLDD